MLDHDWIERSYAEINDDIPIVRNSTKDMAQQNEEVDAEKVAGEKVFLVKMKNLNPAMLQEELSNFLQHTTMNSLKVRKGLTEIEYLRRMEWLGTIQVSYIIDESLLEKSHIDAQKALNSWRIEKRAENTVNKFELLKRAKDILSPDQELRADAAATNTWASSEASNFGFPFLDDIDPWNTLLAEMLRGLVKLSLVKPDNAPAFTKLIRLAHSGKIDNSFFSPICEKLTCLC